MLFNESNNQDRACDLECVKDLAPVQEFVGPVKIILMDMPKSMYKRKAWISAFIALAHILMGFTTFTVLFYTTEFKTTLFINLHIVLCMIGYQLLIPSAILMINSLHGPSASMKKEDRRFQHFFLQLFGITCVIVGTHFVLYSTENIFTVHSIAGFVTGGLSVLAGFTGAATYFTNLIPTQHVHVFLGMGAFFVSTICFITGIVTSGTFKAWAVFLPDLLYILIAFSILYTLIILSTPMMKLCGKTP